MSKKYKLNIGGAEVSSTPGSVYTLESSDNNLYLLRDGQIVSTISQIGNEDRILLRYRVTNTSEKPEISNSSSSGDYYNGQNWLSTLTALPQGLYVWLATTVSTNNIPGEWTITLMSGDTELTIVSPYVIRNKGLWNNQATYVNETLGNVTGDIKCVDVVYYKNDLEGKLNYYMPIVASVTDVAPTDTNSWVGAFSLDFAYIQNLIADIVSATSVLAREVLILNGNSDIIAGMTSGEKEAENPVRIWAGSEITSESTPEEEDLELSDFRVYEDGSLVANNVKLLGTINGVYVGKNNLLYKPASVNLNNLEKGAYYLLSNNTSVTFSGLSVYLQEYSNYKSINSGIQLSSDSVYLIIVFDAEVTICAISSMNSNTGLQNVEVHPDIVELVSDPNANHDWYGVVNFKLSGNSLNELLEAQGFELPDEPITTGLFYINDNYRYIFAHIRNDDKLVNYVHSLPANANPENLSESNLPNKVYIHGICSRFALKQDATSLGVSTFTIGSGAGVRNERNIAYANSGTWANTCYYFNADLYSGASYIGGNVWTDSVSGNFAQFAKFLKQAAVIQVLAKKKAEERESEVLSNGTVVDKETGAVIGELTTEDDTTYATNFTPAKYVITVNDNPVVLPANTNKVDISELDPVNPNPTPISH